MPIEKWRFDVEIVTSGEIRRERLAIDPMSPVRDIYEIVSKRTKIPHLYIGARRRQPGEVPYFIHEDDIIEEVITQDEVLVVGSPSSENLLSSPLSPTGHFSFPLHESTPGTRTPLGEADDGAGAEDHDTDGLVKDEADGESQEAADANTPFQNGNSNETEESPREAETDAGSDKTVMENPREDSSSTTDPQSINKSSPIDTSKVDVEIQTDALVNEMTPQPPTVQQPRTQGDATDIWVFVEQPNTGPTSMTAPPPLNNTSTDTFSLFSTTPRLSSPNVHLSHYERDDDIETIIRAPTPGPSAPKTIVQNNRSNPFINPFLASPAESSSEDEQYPKIKVREGSRHKRRCRYLSAMLHELPHLVLAHILDQIEYKNMRVVISSSTPELLGVLSILLKAGPRLPELQEEEFIEAKRGILFHDGPINPRITGVDLYIQLGYPPSIEECLDNAEDCLTHRGTLLFALNDPELTILEDKRRDVFRALKPLPKARDKNINLAQLTVLGQGLKTKPEMQKSCKQSLKTFYEAKFSNHSHELNIEVRYFIRDTLKRKRLDR